MPAVPRTLILAGEGECLAQQIAADHGGLKRGPLTGCRVVSLLSELGPEESRAACAWAVAALAAEQASGE